MVKSTMLISVVVPTYNEETNILPFYERTAKVLDATGYNWEIIHVNDGSRDQSVDLLLQLRERDARVKCLNLSRNFGSYGAISAGLIHARGDAIACISCDLQDPPELIADFVKGWEQGYDIVWGVRETRTDPGLKSLYANVFYWIIRKLIWRDFPPGGMDYGLFDRRVIDLYNQTPARNNIPFLTIYDMGFRQQRLPYHRQERQRGTSHWTFFRRVKSAIDVVLDFSYFPIRAVTILGFVISLLSLLYATFVVLNRLLFGVGGDGWTSTMAVISFIGGIQLIVLGMLGEYIWRVAEQVRDRPRFIIMDRYGFEDSETPGRQQEIFRPHRHRTSPAEIAAIKEPEPIQ
jgi:glycosyltransferase involved in cell wall biosynthesis